MLNKCLILDLFLFICMCLCESVHVYVCAGASAFACMGPEEGLRFLRAGVLVFLVHWLVLCAEPESS